MARRFEVQSQSSISKTFKVGDILRVSSNEDLVQRKQVSCGGYSKKRMGDLLGTLVYVKHFSPKCVKVERPGPTYDGRDYDLHPDILNYPKDDYKIVRSDDVPEEHSQLFDAINNNDIDKIMEFMYPNTLNCRNEEGKTPINFACCLGKKDIIECLLGFEPDIDIPDNQGYLPIHNCAINDHIDIFKLLLEKFPDHVHRKSENSQPLMNIVRQKKNKDFEICLKNFKELTNRRISESRELSLPISLLNPQMTLSVPTDNTCSMIPVDRYSTSNLTSSLMSAPRDENIRIYQQILQEYETIEVPSMSHSFQQVSLTSSPAENECTICRDGHMNIAFVKCGHLACKKCADRIFKCHICNAEIENKITIYL